MELVKYDEQSGAATITFTRMEFVSIHAALGGVLTTYKYQDPRIIDVPQEELKEICNGLRGILKQLVSTIRK